MLKRPLTWITGASSGIGAACAERFAAHGHDLVLLARRAQRLETLADRLKQLHKTAVTTLVLDIRNRKQVETTLQQHPKLIDSAQVLINNAGLARGLAPLHSGAVDDWEEMLDTNVKGLLFVTRQILPAMVARGDGHVINIGSIAGRQSYASGAVYSATKAAVKMLNEAMRLDLNGTGVRVSGIDPGMLSSEFSNVRFHGDDKRAAAVYNGMTPLAPADVADAALWCVTRPKHVNIQELLIMPTDQASATTVHRR